jgi:hypothetical protein
MQFLIKWLPMPQKKTGLFQKNFTIAQSQIQEQANYP